MNILPEPSDEDIDTSDEDDEFGGGGRNDNPEDQTNFEMKESLIFRSQGPGWKTNEWSLDSGSRKMYYSVMEDIKYHAWENILFIFEMFCIKVLKPFDSNTNTQFIFMGHELIYISMNHSDI